MSKTITLSISKDKVAKGVGRGVGLALDAGLGVLEGSLGSLAVITTLATSYHPIIKWTMAICEALAVGYLSAKLNDLVFEEQEDLETSVAEYIGQLIGADDVVNEKEEEEFEKAHAFSVIG